MDAQYANRPPDHTPDIAASDDTLQRARRGDIEAFRQLLRANQARVFSIALRFTGKRADAEEIMQDVFLLLHGALARISGEEHLRHWLLRTVSHRCIDRLRHAGRRPQLVPIDALNAVHEPHSPERDTDPMAGARLRQLLLELAPDARAVMLLRFQEDMDLTEIADLLTIPLSTVKSHLRRSLDWLRAQLGENHAS